MKSKSNNTLPRRHFLQQLLLLGGATGTAGLMLESGAEKSLTNQSKPANQTQATSATSGNYRLTEHIRTYYEKAQF